MVIDQEDLLVRIHWHSPCTTEASAAAPSLSSFRGEWPRVTAQPLRLQGRTLHLHRRVGDDGHASLAVIGRTVIGSARTGPGAGAEGVEATADSAHDGIYHGPHERHFELIAVGHLDLQRVGVLDGKAGNRSVLAILQIVVGNIPLALEGTARRTKRLKSRRCRI